MVIDGNERHGAGFDPQVLPYGVFSTAGLPDPRVGVAVGGQVLDLTAASAALLPDYAEVLDGGSLDRLLAAGPATWAAVRAALTGWFGPGGDPAPVRPFLVPAGTVRLRLPFTVADFVDFYSGEQHAVNVGRIFRPLGRPLHPNWRRMPVGYHGRAGTVVASGTPIARPRGQCREPGRPVTFGPCARLDFEAEIGFVVGVGSRLGHPVPVDAFAEHVFGICVLNDWSARDIQHWETTPLGPFLAKSFATSISPWVVPLAALDAARRRPPPRDPAPPAYLDDSHSGPWGLDLLLEVRLNGHLLSRPPFATTYWTPAQQLAHLTVNGAAVRTGDLFASGTVSGPDRDQWGSLLELSWNGTRDVVLPDGTTRHFLRDGDEVAISATAPAADGGRLWLGEVRGRVVAEP